MLFLDSSYTDFQKRKNSKFCPTLFEKVLKNHKKVTESKNVFYKSCWKFYILGGDFFYFDEIANMSLPGPKNNVFFWIWPEMAENGRKTRWSRFFDFISGCPNLQTCRTISKLASSIFFIFLSSFLALVESILGPREFLSNILSLFWIGYILHIGWSCANEVTYSIDEKCVKSAMINF